MQLVGAQQVIASDADLEESLRFYGPLFSRLRNDVKHAGGLTRYVGYQRRIDGNDHLHFFGIEVDRIADLPLGMYAWDLTESKRTVWETQDGQDAIISQADIAWRWLDRSCSDGGRWTGEFSAPGAGEFWMSANAYVGLQETDVSSDDVCLVDYDPSWPQQFHEMAHWLGEQLGPEIALSVEHIGSTAIPGMSAKPVIDVMVEIPSFSAAKRRALPLLNSTAWEYWWYGRHMMFVKKKKLMGQRTHHIHMMPQGRDFEGRLAFRDYLKSHDEAAARYADLKRQLADSHRHDRERYTEAKAAFVSAIVSEALSCS